MGNWSGKRKPANKGKRRTKAQKRVERHATEAERSNSASSEDAASSSATSSTGSSLRVSGGASSSVAAPKWYERVRSAWDNVNPQMRILTVVGLFGLIAISVYSYLESRPKASRASARVTATAPAPVQSVDLTIVTPEPSDNDPARVDPLGSASADSSAQGAASAAPDAPSAASAASAASVASAASDAPPVGSVVVEDKPKPKPKKPKPVVQPSADDSNPY